MVSTSGLQLYQTPSIASMTTRSATLSSRNPDSLGQHFDTPPHPGAQQSLSWLWTILRAAVHCDGVSCAAVFLESAAGEPDHSSSTKPPQPFSERQYASKQHRLEHAAAQHIFLGHRWCLFTSQGPPHWFRSADPRDALEGREPPPPPPGRPAYARPLSP